MGLFGYFLPKFLNNVKIITGKWYKCLREMKIISIGDKHEDFEFLKGKVYKSEEEGCITDKNGRSARVDFIPESKFLKNFKPYRHHKKCSRL